MPAALEKADETITNGSFFTEKTGRETRECSYCLANLDSKGGKTASPHTLHTAYRIRAAGLNVLGATKNAEQITETTISESSNQPFQPILTRNLQFLNNYVKPREIWIENMDTIKEEKRGLVHLNPKIFATLPRLDLIHENVKWQVQYRKVVLYSVPTRSERRGGGRKPRPQKGTGKARLGSIRAPQLKGGGKCHGPRSPTSSFYMLPLGIRVHGLTSTLSVKFAQDDLHVVDNINIPVEDDQYILDLIQERNWGPSVLFVDNIDVMPRNITLATDTIGHVTLMPLYGLNVYGMLKHTTLVLTLSALNDLENRLMTVLNSANIIRDTKKYNH
ncbi:hypothetical protein RUM44_011989 [Polyplax serrata]|uniref:Large ribosomal subunit protein uL4m n=1 Tax=Polyplax serrata TaxID=468196 RepID=A0ABR1BA20_POLSC